MNQETKAVVPGWYWVIAVVALLWNLMGCAAFCMEMFAQEAMMETMSEPQKEWARSIPGWIYVLYGIAVSTGVVGSIGLLMRKKWTVAVFAISLPAVLIQMIYSMLIAGGLNVMGPSSLVMPGMVIGLAAFLLWFSWFAKGKGWLAS